MCAAMIKPKIIQKGKTYEVWQFRNQYYQAYIFGDGVVQLRPSDKEGNTSFLFPLNSHNGHDREQAIKWLNDEWGQ